MTALVACPGCRGQVVLTALDAPSGECPSCDLDRLRRLIRSDQQGKPRDDWATFTAALRQVARGGVVRQSDMRALIRGRIPPSSIGRCYSKAIDQGLLTEIGRERSDDRAGRNTNKREPVYRLAS